MIFIKIKEINACYMQALNFLLFSTHCFTLLCVSTYDYPYNLCILSPYSCFILLFHINQHCYYYYYYYYYYYQ